MYADVIRPAAKGSAWEVTRIDEVPAVGAISQQYLREIVLADLVLAEISQPNANVFYELGVRHAVASGGTVLLATAGTSIPFDLKDQRVIFYSLDAEGVSRAIADIRRSLQHELKAPTPNPVRQFLNATGLATSPQSDLADFERDVSARIDRAKSPEQLIALWEWVRNYDPLPTAPLIGLADRLADVRNGP